jgi:hypothetical protein
MMIGESEMNIKVNRLKLIQALEDALQERKDLQIANDNIKQLNESAIEAYEKKLLEFVYTQKLVLHSIQTRVWCTEPLIEATFKVPRNMIKYPKMIDTVWVHAHELKEIENAITLLRMSDAEQVNASSYKSVVGYIK